MYCSKCGSKLINGAEFCTECGQPVNSISSGGVKIVRLVCQDCGGIMSVDEDQDKQVLLCPYCGSKKMLLESDGVKIEKIRSHTELEKERINREIELKKLQYEVEKENLKREKEEITAFRTGRFGKAIFICAIVCSLICAINIDMQLSYHHYLGETIIGFIQSVLFITSWLMGMHIIKVKNTNLYSILAIIAFVLFVPFLIVI